MVDIKLEVGKDQPRVSDACNQTPKRRRSGGKASRMRRLLAYQLMLTRKRRLPPSSRLQLTLEELKRIQEESASPFLREGVVGVKANNNKGKISDHLHLDKEKEGHTSVGTSTGDQPHFPPRSSQAHPVTSTPFQPTQTGTSFFPFPTPWYTWTTSMPLTTFCTPSPNGPMPGQHWVICGSCHSWGTVIMSQ